MRNEFYYFPRVKDANYEKTTYLPGRAGMEFGYDEGKQKFTPVFVVSPDAHNYSYVNLDYYSSDNLGSLDWTNVSDILGRDEDGDGVDGNWDHAGQPRFPYLDIRYGEYIRERRDSRQQAGDRYRFRDRDHRARVRT